MSRPGATVLLLRHGETDHNSAARMQGQLDVGLNDHGRAQARRVAPLLAARSPARIVASDLARAADTATVVAAAAGITVRHDRRLRETCLGDWQGLTHAEIERREPGALGRWRSESGYRPPGGETRTEVGVRGAALLAEVGEEETVLLVAHGGLVAAVTAAALGLPESRWAALGSLGNARWAELRARVVDGAPGWGLQAWNVGAGG